MTVTGDTQQSQAHSGDGGNSRQAPGTPGRSHVPQLRLPRPWGPGVAWGGQDRSRTQALSTVLGPDGATDASTRPFQAPLPDSLTRGSPSTAVSQSSSLEDENAPYVGMLRSQNRRRTGRAEAATPPAGICVSGEGLKGTLPRAPCKGETASQKVLFGGPTSTPELLSMPQSQPGKPESSVWGQPAQASPPLPAGSAKPTGQVPGRSLW